MALSPPKDYPRALPVLRPYCSALRAAEAARAHVLRHMRALLQSEKILEYNNRFLPYGPSGVIRPAVP